jgi:hypothetical protein
LLTKLGNIGRCLYSILKSIHLSIPNFGSSILRRANNMCSMRMEIK